MEATLKANSSAVKRYASTLMKFQSLIALFVLCLGLTLLDG
jgi:hypothetical protein